MDDHPPCVINTVRKAAPENERVNPPLNLLEHQTAHGREGQLLVILLLLQRPLHALPPPGKRLELERIVTLQTTAWTHVGQGLREVPPLERRFGDIVTVVRANHRFTRPALLEERPVRLAEVELGLLRSVGALPEVIQILRVPALRHVACRVSIVRERKGIEGGVPCEAWPARC